MSAQMKNTSEIRGWIVTVLASTLLAVLGYSANDLRATFKENMGGIREELKELNSNVQKLDKALVIQTQQIGELNNSKNDHEDRIRLLERKRP